MTGRVLAMGILVSMGGLIFGRDYLIYTSQFWSCSQTVDSDVGYDTGQISGFLEMDDFLQRFGECDASGANCKFSNVRQGLIVAMVS